MNHNFSFRTDRYNFWPIYDALKKYYPFGIERHHEGLFFEYAGLKKLEDILVENVHNQKNYEERWVKKTKKWQKILGHKIVGTTYGQEPSFSSYLELSKKEIEDRIFVKNIHFAVSLIGPFYTIFVVDSTIQVVKEEDSLSKNNSPKSRYFPQIHRTIISPHAEFTELFSQLRTLIESAFNEYYFVPFFIHSAVLNGFQVSYKDDSLNRIYHGLFNDHFEFNSPITGDQYNYGFEQWMIENPNSDDNWVIMPPIT